MVKTLARCEQCLVFWGSQSEEWVRDVLALDELKGRLGWRLLGVCVAEPATPEKTTFRTNKARVLNGIPTVDESQLRDFIAMKETAQ
jgi:hypothetical protein